MHDINAILKNRTEAGKILAEKLLQFTPSNPIVLALPRGGVVVGCEVAKALKAPMDTIIVRKIGAPMNPEFAIGAITAKSEIINDETVRALGISDEKLQEIKFREKKELERRASIYKSGQFGDGGKYDVVILVDDGFATGLTAEAGIKEARLSYSSAELIVAVPVCAFSTGIELAKKSDKFVCLMEPINLNAISLWYEDFLQISDDEVIKCLKEANKDISEF